MDFLPPHLGHLFGSIDHVIKRHNFGSNQSAAITPRVVGTRSPRDIVTILYWTHVTAPQYHVQVREAIVLVTKATLISRAVRRCVAIVTLTL